MRKAPRIDVAPSPFPTNTRTITGILLKVTIIAGTAASDALHLIAVQVGDGSPADRKPFGDFFWVHPIPPFVSISRPPKAAAKKKMQVRCQKHIFEKACLHYVFRLTQSRLFAAGQAGA